MIAHISTTQRNASVVSVQSCVFGIESQVLKATDPNDIQIELQGEPMKIAYVVGRTGSRIIQIPGIVERQD